MNHMNSESAEDRSPVTLLSLAKMKRDGEKIAVVTAYDAAFGRIAGEAGVDVILVGDSLGMVVQGRDTTIPVTVEEMVYHTRMVSRGSSLPLLMADLPFLSYATPERALRSAEKLMQEGNAQMVKLEGGQAYLETVRRLTVNGVPVCGHLGLLPQSVHKLGGYRVQGREQGAAQKMIEDALALQEAGIDLLVVECIPSELGKNLSETLKIPVIGIGAGPHCDAQVLVLYDLLGITPGRTPKFARNFLDGAQSIQGALQAYVRAVKNGAFPSPEHSF